MNYPWEVEEKEKREEEGRTALAKKIRKDKITKARIEREKKIHRAREYVQDCWDDYIEASKTWVALLNENDPTVTYHIEIGTPITLRIPPIR